MKKKTRKEETDQEQKEPQDQRETHRQREPRQQQIMTMVSNQQDDCKLEEFELEVEATFKYNMNGF